MGALGNHPIIKIVIVIALLILLAVLTDVIIFDGDLFWNDLSSGGFQFGAPGAAAPPPEEGKGWLGIDWMWWLGGGFFVFMILSFADNIVFKGGGRLIATASERRRIKRLGFKQGTICGYVCDRLKPGPDKDKTLGAASIKYTISPPKTDLPTKTFKDYSNSRGKAKGFYHFPAWTECTYDMLATKRKHGTHTITGVPGDELTNGQTVYANFRLPAKGDTVIETWDDAKARMDSNGYPQPGEEDLNFVIF